MQATAPSVTLAQGRRARRPTRPPRRRRHDPLHRLDVSIESLLGVDLRLLYGMLVPMLVILGLVVAVLAVQSYWVVAAAWIVEMAALGLIVTKLLAMLAEPGEAESPPDHEPKPPVRPVTP